MEHVDLFSGIGGFALAAKWTGFKTVVFCEKDDFCQKVLQKRFGGHVADPECRGSYSTISSSRTLQHNNGKPFTKNEEKNIPIIPEIRDFDGTKWRGATLLTGGFPCQPFSVAGKRRGKEDDRYLWPEMFRIIKEAKPHWVLAENVAGIFKMALDTVLADLESEGYTTGTVVIPAAGVNAPHRRDRIWIIGYSYGSRNRIGTTLDGRYNKENRKICSWTSLSNSDTPDSDRINGNDARFSTSKIPLIEEAEIQGCDTSDSTSPGLSESQEGQFGESIFHVERGSWEIPWIEVATQFCRVDDGVPNRVDRLKSLGNAIVPQVAAEIMCRIRMIMQHGK